MNRRQTQKKTTEEQKLTDINFKTSSIKMTGALKYSTAFHSIQLSGVMANRAYRTNERKG